MASVLDYICEPRLLLTPVAVKAPNISKATVQRYISQPNDFYF